MSDGNYKWWTAYDIDDEHWNGPFDTREEAIAKGKVEYGPAGFAICEADKAIYSFGGMFDDISDDELRAAEINIAYVDDLLQRWSESESAIGDAGWHDDGISDGAKIELSERLSAIQSRPLSHPGQLSDDMSRCFEEWAEENRHDFGEVYLFGTQRALETVPSEAVH